MSFNGVDKSVGVPILWCSYCECEVDPSTIPRGTVSCLTCNRRIRHSFLKEDGCSVFVRFGYLIDEEVLSV